MKKFGRPVELMSRKGRINPDYDHPDFVKKISKYERILQEPSQRILFNGRNRISVIPLSWLEEKTINIVAKEFSTRGLNRLKTLFLPSKAQKAWWGGIALMERNIPTPVPIAYLEGSRSPFIEESCYFSILVEGVEEIRYLFRHLSAKELPSLVRALARHLNRCHREGILHRDLSDGNILVKKDVQDEYTFFLIDTNRIRLRKKLGVLQRVKNLTRLGVPRAYQQFFLEEYTGSDRIKKWMWVWYRFSKNAYIWHISLKKRLRLRRETKTRNSI
jgi:serine/threonine protein kinase